jgi:hypothetical protein
MIREARIILPVLDNEGQSVAAAHKHLRELLAKRFGGFTAISGHGGWVDTGGELVAEDVTIYDVAVDDENAEKLGGYEDQNLARSYADGILQAIARIACIEARQVCVYYREPFTGQVSFIGPDITV